jgi:NAD(P)-dependent dehydrogenase (short-subunit alcohol dehydrogenase family)
MNDFKSIFSLDGKVAIVTGGLGILGRHFCKGLADHGATVVVLDIDAEASEAFARDLTARTSNPAVGLRCDVSDPADVAAVVAGIVDELGGIDILHNNAVSKTDDLSALFEPTESYALQQWRNVMAVGLDGMFLVAQAVGKQMIQQGGGSIIQTASIYGIVGPDPRIYKGSEYLGREINTPAVYAAAKGGVVSLTRYLATMWAEHGIRVNTLTPGGVESGQNETFSKNYSARVPMGRMAEASEMVGALVYLASSASSYVTGQNIVVDGGLTAW